MAKYTIKEVQYMSENKVHYLLIIEGRFKPILISYLTKTLLIHHLEGAVKDETYGVAYSDVKSLNEETLIEAESKEELVQLIQMHQLMN